MGDHPPSLGVLQLSFTFALLLGELMSKCQGNRLMPLVSTNMYESSVYNHQLDKEFKFATIFGFGTAFSQVWAVPTTTNTLQTNAIKYIFLHNQPWKHI